MNKLKSKKVKKTKVKKMKNKNHSSQTEPTSWGVGKILRYQLFKFFYFFNTSCALAKDIKEAEEFVDRFENQHGGPQMG